MKIYIAVPILVLIIGCDHGLRPEEGVIEEPGIEGTVTISGGWRDDVEQLRVVAFLNYPPADVFSEVFQGRAKFTSPLVPLGEDSYEYSLDLDQNTYEYVIVAALVGEDPDPLQDWIVVGVYTDDETRENPKPVVIETGVRMRNIDIEVTMHDLPPQPF